MPDNSQLEAPEKSTIYRNPAKAAVTGYKISQSQKGKSHLATKSFIPSNLYSKGTEVPLSSCSTRAYSPCYSQAMSHGTRRLLSRMLTDLHQKIRGFLLFSFIFANSHTSSQTTSQLVIIGGITGLLQRFSKLILMQLRERWGELVWCCITRHHKTRERTCNISSQKKKKPSTAKLSLQLWLSLKSTGSTHEYASLGCLEYSWWFTNWVY